ncbi:unnamed protein product [Protopolystoma xenopodis]|uniref:Uncharacterized protein n=1 Tax=Protopolystoma xenopodis TaxID=117903 RepID=A0A3S5B6A9_9PLAT|nr:unnamed protein product [Protopolystoma xenopodis]
MPIVADKALLACASGSESARLDSLPGRQTTRQLDIQPQGWQVGRSSGGGGQPTTVNYMATHKSHCLPLDSSTSGASLIHH